MKLILLFCFYAILSMPASGQSFSEILVIKNFTTGGADYVIKGSRAIISGNRVVISEIKAFFQKQDMDVLLISSGCDFDQLSKVGHSNKPVRVKTENMTIDGVGFDLNVGQSRIVIRNNVKVSIYNYLKNSLKKINKK